MAHYILAIDQGTTSSRAIVFNREGQIISSAQKEFSQYYPQGGWVEHDPEEIWQSVLAVSREAIRQAQVEAGDIHCIGITNQRETTLVWDKGTGRPIHRAIVWQDRRTAAYCQALVDEGRELSVQKKTGLLIDPYFSATKLKWILDNVDHARQKAETGQLAFGTIDTFLIWRLTEGKTHVTDATNASRTMLYNIHDQQWDPDLLDLFEIPAAMLPSVMDCSADFGETVNELFGAAIPITGVAGDQQAATVGQACFEEGMAKSTYGTGCFMLYNTGSHPIASTSRLLTTTAYQFNGKPTYAIEGSIFIAGAAVQWLRDKAEMISHAKETETLAKSVPDSGGVYVIPAFTGLGAPYWDPYARGAILGITRDTSRAHIVRATLEAICFRTKDLMEAIARDGTTSGTGHIKDLRVDGGMVVNNWVLQFLSNILGAAVERPQIIETTALGAAFLAGLQAGLYDSLEEISAIWQVERRFNPTMDEHTRTVSYQGWQSAVERIIG